MYPVVSTKVVETFACHDIDGTLFLRADYSIGCYTSGWTSMAAYAGVWVGLYVILFPLFILWTLWSHQSMVQRGKGESFELDSTAIIDLRFLCDDFKPLAPMVMWEWVELVRKLLLSVVGSFWTTKSATCVAVALLISSFYLAIHLSYQPYRCPSVNRLQTLALTALSLMYFAVSRSKQGQRTHLSHPPD
jgi:hypothetical protein